MTNYQIPMELAMKFESKLSDKVELEKLAKSFIYDDSETMSANLKVLGNLISSNLQLSGRIEDTLRQYLVEKNIPIEVNFKPLRVEQLKSIIEQWLSFHTQTSTIVTKLYTNHHRNILFKRVMFEQKQTISDYFSTLSEKNMLKAVDLYQLLVDILSNYCLYQFNIDPQTFFEKVNSFNSFVEIVEKFVHSPKRISLGNKKEDFDFVRRIEFQRLIQFWEEENHELTLLSERRINKVEAESQTTLLNIVEKDIQTQNQTVSLIEFINNSLVTLNKLTVSTEKSQELKIIQYLYSCLRKSKINLIDKREPSAEQSSHIFAHKEFKINMQSQLNLNEFRTPKQSIDINETIMKDLVPGQFLELIDKSDSELEFARTVSPPKHVKDVLERIYNLYKQFSGFSIKNLQNCFIDIGIIERRNDPLTTSFVQRNIITDRQHISYQQFKNIFNNLMQKDKDLTYQVLQQFINSKQNYLRMPISGNRSNVGHYSPNRSRVSSTYTPRNYFEKYLNSTLHY